MFQEKQGPDKEKGTEEHGTCKTANEPLWLQHKVYIMG